MIRVDRGRLASPTVLSTRRARTERTRAEAFFAALRASMAAPAPAPPAPGGGKEKEKKKTFSFAVYRDDEVKALLNGLFRGKCAYCESRYAATQPMDVEHFRPKAEATDFDGSRTIGYYWLASDWTNLLPSCIDCNRQRRHRVAPTNEEMLAGKETLFPIAPGTRRAGPGEPLDVERPLLLDPCRDRPDEYLAFSEGVVVARADAGAPADAAARVDASVRVYGLNRTELVQDRWRVLLTLRRHFDQIRQLRRLLAGEGTRALAPDVALVVENLISLEAAAVDAMARPTEPYSLMVAQEVAAFEAELGAGLPP